MDTVEAGGLSVAKALYDFMNDEALPETGLAVEHFWDGLGAIIRGFARRGPPYSILDPKSVREVGRSLSCQPLSRSRELSSLAADRASLRVLNVLTSCGFTRSTTTQ
jgi:hypothetical protein